MARDPFLARLAALRRWVAEGIPESWTDPIVDVWQPRRDRSVVWLQVRWLTPAGRLRCYGESFDRHAVTHQQPHTLAYVFIRRAQVSHPLTTRPNNGYGRGAVGPASCPPHRIG